MPPRKRKSSRKASKKSGKRSGKRKASRKSKRKSGRKIKKTNQYTRFIRAVTKYLGNVPSQYKKPVAVWLYRNYAGLQQDRSDLLKYQRVQGWAANVLAQNPVQLRALGDKLRKRVNLDQMYENLYTGLNAYRGKCKDNRVPCPRYCTKRKNKCVNMNPLYVESDLANVRGGVNRRLPFSLKKQDFYVNCATDVEPPNCGLFCRKGRGNKCVNLPRDQKYKAYRNYILGQYKNRVARL